MKLLIAIILLSSSLFAHQAPFAAQVDAVADLSDGVLLDIYHECGTWIQPFGTFRERQAKGQRAKYSDWYGGLLAGINAGSHVGFLAGAAWGGIDIREEHSFDSQSYFLGMTFDKALSCYSVRWALVSGFLGHDRFMTVNENPQGLFLTSELELQSQYCCTFFNARARYAGFFSKDFQHRETQGTLYVQDHAIQLLTLQGEVSTQVFMCLEPYLGIAGRFQVDGNRIRGNLTTDQLCFADGLRRSLVYGIFGVRASRDFCKKTLSANLEANYDSDQSWRLLGEASLNFHF